MKASKSVLVADLLLLSVGGCRSIVGDPCETAADCTDGLQCELTLPGGYCTRAGCDQLPCPDEGVCVEFDAHTTFCMQPCSVDDECRDGYSCYDGLGPHPFCHAQSALGDAEL